MNKTKAPLKLIAFDTARYLDGDEAVAEYIAAVLETNNPDCCLLHSAMRSERKAWRKWRKTQVSDVKAFTKPWRQERSHTSKPS